MSYRPISKVGLVNLGLEGPAAFPEQKLGFDVQWRVAPTGVRRALRQDLVAGVVVQVELSGVESAAAVVRSVARENNGLDVWLAMSSPRAFLLAKVVATFPVGPGLEADLQALTPRELEVLGSIRQGFTNQAIASRLGVSLSTIKRHVEHILLKLEAKNRAQAAARARRQTT